MFCGGYEVGGVLGLRTEQETSWLMEVSPLGMDASTGSACVVRVALAACWLPSPGWRPHPSQRVRLLVSPSPTSGLAGALFPVRTVRGRPRGSSGLGGNG